MSWRSQASIALATVLASASEALERGDIKEARRIIREAYPFGQRRFTPYKVWCEEVRRRLPGLYPQRTHPVNEQGVPLFQ